MLHFLTALRFLLVLALVLVLPVQSAAQRTGSVSPRLPPEDLIVPQLPVPALAEPLEPPPAAPPLQLAGPPTPAELLEPDPADPAPVEADPEPASPPESSDPAFPAPAVVGAEDSLSLARRAIALLRAEDDVPEPEPDEGLVLQGLARAVFAAPVAGSIPYVLHAQVYHDLTIVFPPAWSVVDVHVGDPARWAVSQARHLILVKPGEIGIRTNLTAVFSNGDILQMDLQEVTGVLEHGRTGRVYVGPERWLVDRIFGMLPPEVRHRVAKSPATVAELLAAPVTVVGLYGGTGAVPSPLAAAVAREGRQGASLPDVAPAPTLGVLDGVESSTVVEPAQPQPIRAGEPAPLGAAPAVSSLPDPDGAVQPLLGSGRWIDGGSVADLEAELRAAVNRVESARIAAGDRVAAAQMNVELEIEALRAEYPLRTQFSYLLDPVVPPYTEPWWHFGVWHDGEHTYWRALAEDPKFVDEDSGQVVPSVLLRNYLYRLDYLVENGSVVVADPDSGRERVLYFRRRREIEGP